jgi:hypothetical protein
MLRLCRKRRRKAEIESIFPRVKDGYSPQKAKPANNMIGTAPEYRC